MPITLIVRPGGGQDSRLTFDGTQRVVIGRGAGSDVRLPDASVSHRHATLRAQGADFVVVDERSTNGTFVGDVRVAPLTSRIVRSGDRLRIGRVWIEIEIGPAPATRDLAVATRDLALALVSRAMEAAGADRTTTVRVVEGRDQGADLPLIEAERPYVFGRAPSCDLPLADADVSREHVRVWLRAGRDDRDARAVLVRDLGTKNGTWIGEARVPDDRDVIWRPATMMRIGRTVLALSEPATDALAYIEGLPDEAIVPADLPAPPPPAPVPARSSSPPRAPGEATSKEDTGPARHISAASGPPAPSPTAALPPPGSPLATTTRTRRAAWSIADILVMATAVGVLVLSLLGLAWLLRG